MNTIPKLPLRPMLALACALALSACNPETPDASDTSDVAPAPETATETPPAMPAPETAPAAAQETGDVAAQFATMDANADGGVSADEHAGGAASMFATMDADGNGMVTVEEMDASQAALGGDPRMASADKIKAVDGDGDGQLSREEHAQGAKTMYDQMDADHDGRLTPAELQAGHDARMGG